MQRGKAIPNARHTGHIALYRGPFPILFLNNYHPAFDTPLFLTLFVAQPSTVAAKQLYLQPCQPQQYPKLRLATRYSALPSTDQVTYLSVVEEVPVKLLIF
jgi:hypothetical protein